jgi:hypothetical protein
MIMESRDDVIDSAYGNFVTGIKETFRRARFRRDRLRASLSSSSEGLGT